MRNLVPRATSILIALLFLACTLGVVGYALQYTNISRSDYDAALAKWHSQGVEEYEMVVADMAMWNAGIWTLHVRDKDVGIVGMSLNGTPLATPSGATGDALKPITIEGLFPRIDEMLTRYGPIDLEARCWVYFDPTLGYPSTIDCNSKPWRDATDSHNYTCVRSLKILKQRTPTQ